MNSNFNTNMFYTSKLRLELCKKDYLTIDNVFNYLYTNNLDEISRVNENNSIKCINKDNILYAGYDLFDGCYIYKFEHLYNIYTLYLVNVNQVSDNLLELIYDKINDERIGGEYLSYYKTNTLDIIKDYKYFCGYLIFLLSFSGEYGDDIFTISCDKDKWYINFERLE